MDTFFYGVMDDMEGEGYTSCGCIVKGLSLIGMKTLVAWDIDGRRYRAMTLSRWVDQVQDDDWIEVDPGHTMWPCLEEQGEEWIEWWLEWERQEQRWRTEGLDAHSP